MSRPQAELSPAVWLAIAVSVAAGCANTPSDPTNLPARQYRQLSIPQAVAAERLSELRNKGLQILQRLGPTQYLVSATTDTLAELKAQSKELSLSAARTTLGPRLSETLAEQATPASGTAESLELWLLFAADQPAKSIENRLRAFDPNAKRVGFAPLYQLSIPAARLPAVEELPGLRHIDLPPRPAIALLDQTRKSIGVESLHNIDLSSNPPTYGLAGEGTVGGIWDPDGVDPTHEDLTEALLRYPNPSFAQSTYHGTAVGGCLAGRGQVSHKNGYPWQPYSLRGIAPEAKLAMYLTSGDRNDQGKKTHFSEEYLQARNEFGIDVASFSFSHAGSGTYTAAGTNLDYLITGIDQRLPAPIPIVVAAGNEAWWGGYGSVTSFASAKNIITVGATVWPTSALWSASSMGPTNDGRLKPEVMAPGCSTDGAMPLAIDSFRLMSYDEKETPIEWTFDVDNEEWTVGRDLEEIVLPGNGTIQTRTTGSNPYLVSSDQLKIDTSKYQKLEITMALKYHHQSAVYWRGEGENFRGNRRSSFFVNGDGKMHTYTIDLGSHSRWKGEVVRLRLDPIQAGIALAAPGSTYALSCGTSMSTPVVAGGILLLLQKWRAVFPDTPRPTPAFFKTLLVATARDLVGENDGANPDLDRQPTQYGMGPDFATGYGEVDIGRGVALIAASAAAPTAFWQRSIKQAQNPSRLRFTLSSAAAEDFSISLGWDDFPGEPGAKQILQNDLDLWVEGADGQIWRPWILDPTNPNAPASRGIDRLNNLEQVPLGNLPAGQYTVVVAAYQMVSQHQDFSLIFSDKSNIETIEVDGDGDGYYADDCDDGDATVNPGQVELINAGRDDDCNESTADPLLAVDSGSPDQSLPPRETPEASSDHDPLYSGRCQIGPTVPAPPWSLILFPFVYWLWRGRKKWI